MLLDNHQNFHHIFIEFFIYGGNIVAQKGFLNQHCNTFLDIYTNREQNQIHKNIY